MDLYDVIIIGGGPAGLNAAVVLGRSRRKVILFDTGKYRNITSHGIHNYLTRDGIKPASFLALARKDALRYGTLIRKNEIVFARQINKKHFIVKDSRGIKYQSRKLLVATGLMDRKPGLKGFDQFYGTSVFHCPYCDAWEVRDKQIGVYASSKAGFELALALRSWSKEIIYFTNGKKIIDNKQARVFKQYNIRVINEKIQSLEGKNRKLRSVLLANGQEIPCEAIFFSNGYSPQSHLVEMMGCRLTKKKEVITNRFQQTNIPGLFVAGDASRDVHFVVVAAAEGAKAGVIINKELQKEERTRFLQ
jgi:thioredoxin reductase